MFALWSPLLIGKNNCIILLHDSWFRVHSNNLVGCSNSSQKRQRPTFRLWQKNCMPFKLTNKTYVSVIWWTDSNDIPVFISINIHSQRVWFSAAFLQIKNRLTPFQLNPEASYAQCILNFEACKKSSLPKEMKKVPCDLEMDKGASYSRVRFTLLNHPK